MRSASKNTFKNGICKAAAIILLAFVFLIMAKSQVFAESSTKIHIVTVNQSTNAIIVESNGRFGMVDSGEDNNYPSHPRSGVTIGRGVENKVKSYMRSLGINSSNFDFYIGTHAHSDHIGSADQIIREFKPKKVYTPEYKDSYMRQDGNYKSDEQLEQKITEGNLEGRDDIYEKVWYAKDARGLYDNEFVYKRLVAAAKDVGAELIVIFNSQNDHFDFGNAKIQLFNTSQEYRRTGTPNANEMSLGVRVTSENGVSAFLGGDMTNIKGIESREMNRIGKVSLMTTNHHGYWGSNSYNFINTLDPKVMVSTNSRVYLSTRPDPNDSAHTSFNTISNRVRNGMKIYSTGALSGRIPAMVFQLDDKLTNNLPSSIYDGIIGYGYQCDTRHLTLYNGQIISGVRSGVDGKWIKNGNRWWFYYYGGGYPSSQIIDIDGTLYNFDSNGYLLQGWERLNGYWVYFGSGGHMVKGWVHDAGYDYYLDDNYHMVTGKQFVDGKMREFNQYGKAKKGWEQRGNDWYYYEKGTAYSGWKLSYNKKWYYLDENGRMITEDKVINGVKYHFNKDGSMAVGWEKVDGDWYYYQTSGKMVENRWLKINNIWYYFDKSGKMATGLTDINNVKYYFADSGKMIYGWHKAKDGTWYYGKSNGYGIELGWKKINGIWYYFDQDGKMATGSKDIGGKTYFFLNSGKMHSGWNKLNDGTWNYYLPSGEKAFSRWRIIGNTWYYFDNEGTMVTGKFNVGNTDYFFLNSGAMKTGWGAYRGSWLYADNNGSLVKSAWRKVNNIWYYFDGDGEMVTGSHEIAGRVYNFTNSGALQN